MMTIKLNRIQIYLIGILVILVFIFFNRLTFILGGKVVAGQVVNTVSWSSSRGLGRYSAPIIKFKAHTSEITFRGETNLDLKPGEFVPVIYKTDNPLNVVVFNFVGFLLPSFLYSILPLLFLSSVTFSFIAPTDRVEIQIKHFYKLSFIISNSSDNPITPME